jgi:small-conductance mechanosensitive channel
MPPGSNHLAKQAALFVILISCILIFGNILSFPAQAGFDAQTQTGDQTPTPPVEVQPTPLPGVPIEVGGEVIGYVRERLGPLTPTDRAELLSKDINELATNPFAPPVEFEVVESDIGTDILANGEVLLTVTDADAAAVNADRQELAAYAAGVIASAIERTRAQNTPRARLMRWLESLAFLLATSLVLMIINRFYHRLVKRVEAVQEEQDQRGFIRSTQFYRSGTWKGVAKLVLNISRWIIFLVILIVLLPFVLQNFPATASLAKQLLNLITIPLRSFWTWLVDNRSNFLTLGIIGFFIYVLIRLERWFFNEIAQGGIKISGFEPEWAPFTSKLLAVLLAIGGVVVAFPYIPGSGSAAFQGVSLFLGALITISSASAVTNIISGIIQTYTGSFSVGDVIRIGEVTGIVIEKRVLTTRVRSFKNEEVSIPNSAVLNGTVTNYSTMAKQRGLVLYTTVTIGYDVPWMKVQELLIAAAEAVPGIADDPKPFVLQTSLNDYHISYQLNCYTDSPERMPRIYSALHANIQDQFNKAGVEIMSPAFSALRDGNTVTIPPENLPDDYRAPGFRVNT